MLHPMTSEEFRGYSSVPAWMMAFGCIRAHGMDNLDIYANIYITELYLHAMEERLRPVS